MGSISGVKGATTLCVSVVPSDRFCAVAYRSLSIVIGNSRIRSPVA
jgi:hypothetical protein